MLIRSPLIILHNLKKLFLFNLKKLKCQVHTEIQAEGTSNDKISSQPTVCDWILIKHKEELCARTWLPLALVCLHYSSPTLSSLDTISESTAFFNFSTSVSVKSIHHYMSWQSKQNTTPKKKKQGSIKNDKWAVLAETEDVIWFSGWARVTTGFTSWAMAHMPWCNFSHFDVMTSSIGFLHYEERAVVSPSSNPHLSISAPSRK